jgi:hypothetical protein
LLKVLEELLVTWKKIHARINYLLTPFAC